MVVDLRYHVASLVAVFLALGLGVLVGASLFGDVSGSAIQEQLLAAVEREMDVLRADRRRVSTQLERALEERDLYIDITSELTNAVMQDRLAGKTLALVVVGQEGDGLAELESLVSKAGASVFTKLLVGEKLEDLALVPPGIHDLGAVVVLNGSPDHYATAFFATLERLKNQGITKVVAMTTGDDWRQQLIDTGITYISEGFSPIGQLSMLLMLSADEVGANEGVESEWPRHLLYR